MIIDVEGAEESGESDEMCLVGEVHGRKGTSESDEEKRGAGPDDGGPSKGERQPERYEKHERGEIGKRTEEDALVFGGEEVPRAAGNHKRVGVEKEARDEEADGELIFGRRNGWRVEVEDCARGLAETIVESWDGLVDEHIKGGDEGDEQFEAAENKQAVEGELRADGLVFEDADQQGGVEQGAEGRNRFLCGGLDTALDVRPAVDRPA